MGRLREKLARGGGVQKAKFAKRSAERRARRSALGSIVRDMPITGVCDHPILYAALCLLTTKNCSSSNGIVLN